MNRRSIPRLLLTLFLGAVLGAFAWSDPPSQVGRLSFIQGSVSFLPGSLDEWTQASLNYPLTQGDQLWTDDGARAEVQLSSASLRLNSGTAFSFLNLDDQQVQLRLTQGSLYVYIRGLGPPPLGGVAFEIDTPNAAVSLRAAGKYRVDVRQNGDTSIDVRSGDAEVTAGGFARDVPSGQSTVVFADSVSYSGSANPPPDEWDSWCSARDAQGDLAASNPYISREMIGAGDLDDADGTWFVAAGYGPAWAPSRVPADWAPYRFGHWAWVEPWGWTWIDEEPWGFAPFHYGRWAFIGERWAWIPGAAAARPIYAPALVVFVGGSGWAASSGDVIGWFALGRNEIYVPPYQASVTYVQQINVTYVTNINVRVIHDYDAHRAVYANRGLSRSITFFRREDFARSRRATRLPVSQEQLARAPIVGTTAPVAPRPESVLARPVGAPVPKPPAYLQTRTVLSRIAPPPARVPFARQENSLAANPGRPLDPLTLSALRTKGPQQPAPQVSVVKPTTVVSPAAVERPAPVVRPATIEKSAIGERPQSPAPYAAPRPEAAAPSMPPGRSQARPASQAGTSASSLISSIKSRTLPEAERSLADARKIAGIGLDLNAADRRIASSRAALAAAERDLSARNDDRALQEASAVQGQLESLIGEISAAEQSARRDRIRQ